MRVESLSASECQALQERVAGLERGITYPLGEDRFQIDHGADYFAFYRRLGEARIFAAFEGEDLAGIAVFVLRDVPSASGAGPCPAWYVCDLKIGPRFRGRDVLTRLLVVAKRELESRSSRAYGISMDPAGGAPNRVVRLVERLSPLPIRVVGRLRFLTLDHARVLELLPLLRRHRGELSFLSMRGKKDIVLESTRAPMPLLHIQHGPAAQAGEVDPLPGHQHMICFPDGDALCNELSSVGERGLPSATIMASRMADRDWSFVLTSDI